MNTTHKPNPLKKILVLTHKKFTSFQFQTETSHSKLIKKKWQFQGHLWPMSTFDSNRIKPMVEHQGKLP